MARRLPPSAAGSLHLGDSWTGCACSGQAANTKLTVNRPPPVLFIALVLH